MNEKTKMILKEWVLPIMIIGILWVTGWYKPVMSFFQQMILSTGIIKPDTEIREGEPVVTTDYQWELVSSSGEIVPFQTLKGKVVFLNFFATWCPPCIAETPGIQDLYDDVASEDFVFVILSRDDALSKTTAFMERKEYSLPVYGTRTRIPEEFMSSVLPTTYIIDKKGRIVSQHSGMADYNNDKVRNFLRELESE